MQLHANINNQMSDITATQTLVPINKLQLDPLLNHFHITVRLKPEEFDLSSP